MPKRKGGTTKAAETKKAKITERLTQDIFDEELKKIEEVIEKDEIDTFDIRSLEKLFEDTKEDEERFIGLFKRIFGLIINKKHVSDKLIAEIKHKIDNLPIPALIECSMMFINKVKLINDHDSMHTHIFNLCMRLITILENNIEEDLVEENLDKMAEELLDIEFNNHLALKLLDVFKILKLSAEQFEIFINKLFNHQNKNNYFKWETVHLVEFFHKLMPLLGVYEEQQKMLFESIMFYFHRLNIQTEEYIQNRSFYKDAEKCALDGLVKFLKSDRSATEKFLVCIKPILDLNFKDKYFSKFTVALMLTLSQTVQKQFRQTLLTIFINSLQKLVEIDVYCSKYTWLATTMNVKSKMIIKKFSNICEFSRLSELVDYNVAYKALNDLALNILDFYGVSITINVKPMTIRENLTSIATSILQDVFRNCIESRELICKSLLDAVNVIEYDESSDKDATVFVDQLHVLFKSKSSVNYLEYRKNVKLQNLILKYLTKSVFELSLECSIQLLNIFEIYLQVNNSQTRKLIELFKNHLDDPTEKKRQISIFGLLIILKAFCSINNKEMDVNERTTEEDVIKITVKDCMNLFNKIKERISVETDAFVKSKVYQSLRGLISLENGLIEPVFSFLTTKLDDLIHRTSTQSFFKIDNCIEKIELKLIEPVDVLIHSAHVCYGYLITQDSQLDLINDTTKGHVEKLEEIFEEITSSIIENDAEYVFTVYKKQIETKLKTHGKLSIPSIRMLSQVQLGIMDAMIENSFSSQKYVNILKLLQKYEQTLNLISVDIEQIIPPTPLVRTEHDREHLTPHRKRKAVEMENKENIPTSFYIPHTPPQTPTRFSDSNKFSLTNLVFDHTHRVSYTASLDMLQACLGLTSDNLQISVLNTENLNALITIISNNGFLDYFTQIVDKKIQALLKKRNPYSIHIYDPESYDYRRIFKFIETIWRTFWQRIHGVSKDSVSSAFGDILTLRYSANYLNKILKYQSFLNNIWTITSQKFGNKLIELFNQKGAYNEIVNKIIEETKVSIKNYTQDTGDHASISIKIVTGLYNQLFEIISKLGCETNLDVHIRWLLKESDKHMSINLTVGSAILKLLFRLNEIRASPAVHLKFLAMDYENFMRREAEDYPFTDINDYDIVNQYNLFSKENSVAYFQTIAQESVNLINLSEWFLKHNENFNDSKALQIFYDQLFMITLVCYHQLKSCYGINLVQTLMEHLTKLYSFMSTLIKHRMANKMSVDEGYSFKQIITLIATKLQANLSYTFNRIQGYMLNEEQQREGKADATEISKIIRYKHSINTLIDRIDEFEKDLLKLNSVNRDINFVENYTKFISNIEIKFQSRVTRTISEHQIKALI